jgi:hypothetical protein
MYRQTSCGLNGTVAAPARIHANKRIAVNALRLQRFRPKIVTYTRLPATGKHAAAWLYPGAALSYSVALLTAHLRLRFTVDLRYRAFF